MTTVCSRRTPSETGFSECLKLDALTPVPSNGFKGKLEQRYLMSNGTYEREELRNVIITKSTLASVNQPQYSIPLKMVNYARKYDRLASW